MDNVIEIATTLLFIKNKTRLLLETYHENPIYEIKRDEISEVLQQMSYDKCKVVLAGKDLCAGELCEGATPAAKDLWF